MGKLKLSTLFENIRNQQDGHTYMDLEKIKMYWKSKDFAHRLTEAGNAVWSVSTQKICSDWQIKC